MFDSNHLKLAFFKNLVLGDLREDTEGCKLVAVVLYMARFPNLLVSLLPSAEGLNICWLKLGVN